MFRQVVGHIRRQRFSRLLAAAAGAAASLALVSPAVGSLGTKGGEDVGGALAAPDVPAAMPGDGAMWQDNVQGAFRLSATVVLPKLKCGRSAQAIQVTVGGVGAAPSWAGEFVGCSKGQAHYWPWLVADGRGLQAPGWAAHAGDTIVVSISVNSTKTEVSVVDRTRRRASRQLTGPGGVGGGLEAGTLPVINGATSEYEGVPNFGTLTYSHAVVDGQPLGTASSLAEYDYYRGGTLLIATSPFSSDGETFKLIFNHS